MVPLFLYLRMKSHAAKEPALRNETERFIRIMGHPAVRKRNVYLWYIDTSYNKA